MKNRKENRDEDNATYDLRNKAEVTLLIKRLDDDTVDSIEGLPGSMILLVPEKACPTMTLQDLKEKLSDKKRIKYGVVAD